MRPSTKVSLVVLAALLLAFQPQPVHGGLLGGLLGAVGSLVGGVVTTVGTVVGGVVGTVTDVVCTLDSILVSILGESVSIPLTKGKFSGYDTFHVPYDVNEIYLQGVPTNPKAGKYLTYRRGLVSSLLTLISSLLGVGVKSAAISLTVGNNIITVEVSGSCSCTYTFTVCRDQKTGTHGDPIFNGMLGQEFQVHGVSGEVYSLISDETMQMNSRFIFLRKGECPMIDGRRAQACWSQPGSYMGEIGIKTNGGDRIFIASGSAKTGFAKVYVNEHELELDDVTYLKTQPIGGSENALVARKAFADTAYIVRNSSHLVTIQLSNFHLDIENSDHFMNYRMYVTNWNALAGTHGLLGQTYQKPSKPGSEVKEIEGSVDDYQIADHSLFGDDFAFNRFNTTDDKFEKADKSDDYTEWSQSMKEIESESTELLEDATKLVDSVVDTVKSELIRKRRVDAVSSAEKKKGMHFGGGKMRRHPPK